MALSATDRAQRLRDLAFELETLATAAEQPSRSLGRAERMIAEGERIADAVRSLFRGGR